MKILLAPVPVFLRHNKLSYVKWARIALHQQKIPHFLKMAGIFANKLGVETHALTNTAEATITSIPCSTGNPQYAYF